jgi:O-antigen/teichoic acid export membrane protein
MMVPLAIGAVLFPAAAASYRARPERTGALLRLSVLPTIAIVFPACVVLAGGSHTLLALWIGKSFAADSATILVVFTIGTFLGCVALLPGTLSDAVGRPEIGAAILLVQAALFLPVIVLMTRHYGVTGAAVTWMLRALFNCAARITACRLLGLAAASLVPRLLAVSVAGVAGLLACWLVEPWLLRLGVMAAVAAAVPALAAAMLLEAGERAQIGRMVRRFVPGATLAFATPGGAKTPCVQRE